MSSLQIIEQAAADGVALALSESGNIKASGDQATLNRWRPVIRDHKPGIIKALLEAQACTDDLEAISLWLTHIGEHDPAIVADVLKNCQLDKEALRYFLARAKEQL